MALTARQKRQLEALKQLEQESLLEERKLVKDVNKFLLTRYGKGWRLSEIDVMVQMWKNGSTGDKLPSQYQLEQEQARQTKITQSQPEITE